MQYFETYRKFVTLSNGKKVFCQLECHHADACRTNLI